MLVGRKYRLDLTESQAVACRSYGDICRDVWNTGLEQRRIYRQRGAWMNYVPQSRELTEAKREFPWLAEAPSCCLQQTLMDLDKACRAHGTFKVHWRSKSRWAASFRFPEGGRISIERLNKNHARVKLPKLGWVRFRWSRHIGGQIRNATVSFKAGHWYVSFLVEDGEVEGEGGVARGGGEDGGALVGGEDDDLAGMIAERGEGGGRQEDEPSFAPAFLTRDDD